MSADMQPTAGKPRGDFWKHRSLAELAAEQGVKPVMHVEDLRADFWPADESVEEFLTWLRQARREGQ